MEQVKKELMLQSWVGRPSGGRIPSQETSVWELWPSQVDSGNHPLHLPGAGPVLDPDCHAFWTAGSSKLLNSRDTCAMVVASFLFHIPPRFCSPNSQSAVMSVLTFGHVGSSVSDAECHQNTNSPECLLCGIMSGPDNCRSPGFCRHLLLLAGTLTGGHPSHLQGSVLGAH